MFFVVGYLSFLSAAWRFVLPFEILFFSFLEKHYACARARQRRFSVVLPDLVSECRH